MCSASLQSLSLSGGRVRGNELFTCLGLMPSLVELCLSSWSLQDEIAGLIGPFSYSSDYFLPRLQILEYEGRPTIASQDITSLLLSRFQQGITGNVSQLRQVRLRVISSPSEVPLIGWLQHPKRVAEGMYLSVERVSKVYELITEEVPKAAENQEMADHNFCPNNRRGRVNSQYFIQQNRISTDLLNVGSRSK